MDHQDWTTVTLKRRISTKDAQAKGHTVAETRDLDRSEKARLSKLDNLDGTELPKKRVHPESTQVLIRKRIELGLNQEKADQKCSFPRHTFKNIESNHHLPTPSQQSAIQKHFGVQLKIETYH
jgi:hypothetical protein